jgi:YfiR/HmsC-like
MATVRTFGSVRISAGRVLVLLSVAWLIAGPAVVRAQGEAPYSIETVKAAFLYRFLEYVDWPIDAKADGPLTIAVLGDDSLSAELHRNVRGRMAHGREIEARPVRTVQEGLDAHVLFISASARNKLAGAAGPHDRDPVLVVTEGDGALDAGAVINFVVVDGNVRFEVSLPAAEQRGLKLSSRLLNVALRVEKSGSAPKRGEPATSALAAAEPAAQANAP